MNKPVLVVMAAGMGSRYGGMKQIDGGAERSGDRGLFLTMPAAQALRR